MGRLTVCQGHYCFITCVEEAEDEDHIRENCSMYSECYEKNIYDKLARYEDLEEQGRLIEIEGDKKDVVEVIRCKDCIYKWFNGVNLHTCIRDTSHGEPIVNLEDFCSYGKKVK